MVDHTLYRSMIDNLLYLTISRPNIVQTVCMVARFQAAPKQSHMNVVIRIYRYLQGKLSYGLWYTKQGEFTLEAYIDDWKSTSGGVFFLGDQLVLWHCKK